MISIVASEIESLNGSELLEIRLKTLKTVRGYITATSTSHSSFFSQSKGMLEFLIIKTASLNDIKEEYQERIISLDEIKEIFIFDIEKKNL